MNPLPERVRTWARSDWIALAAVFVMAVAAGYEAAVALEWIPVGTLPGEGARFEGFFLATALLALPGLVLSRLVVVPAPPLARDAAPPVDL